MRFKHIYYDIFLLYKYPISATYKNYFINNYFLIFSILDQFDFATWALIECIVWCFGRPLCAGCGIWPRPISLICWLALFNFSVDLFVFPPRSIDAKNPPKRSLDRRLAWVSGFDLACGGDWRSVEGLVLTCVPFLRFWPSLSALWARSKIRWLK